MQVLWGLNSLQFGWLSFMKNPIKTSASSTPPGTLKGIYAHEISWSSSLITFMLNPSVFEYQVLLDCFSLGANQAVRLGSIQEWLFHFILRRSAWNDILVPLRSFSKTKLNIIIDNTRIVEKDIPVKSFSPYKVFRDIVLRKSFRAPAILCHDCLIAVNIWDGNTEVSTSLE